MNIKKFRLKTFRSMGSDARLDLLASIIVRVSKGDFKSILHNKELTDKEFQSLSEFLHVIGSSIFRTYVAISSLLIIILCCILLYLS